MSRVMEELDRWDKRRTETIERRLNRQRDKILTEIGKLKKRLEKNPSYFARDIGFIEDKIIPYIKRKKHLPSSYRKMLKFMQKDLEG